MPATQLEEITPVCVTPQELIKSADFMRGVKIITQDERIVGLFTKLQNDEVLDEEEKEELLKFVSDDKIAKKGQELLSKLKSVSVNIKTNNLSELNSFTDLLNSIFAEDGYKKVTKCVGEVAGIAELTLNAYEGMDEIVLNSLGGRKIYVKLFVEADDTTLIYELSDGAKSNFPESEIKNNPELITRNKRGFYHFGHTASNNRLKELGMRYLTDEEKNSKEFCRYIVEKLGDHKENFPGYRIPFGSDILLAEDKACFWGDSIDENNASSIVFNKFRFYIFYHSKNKSYGLCLLGVKD